VHTANPPICGVSLKPSTTISFPMLFPNDLAVEYAFFLSEVTRYTSPTALLTGSWVILTRDSIGANIVIVYFARLLYNIT